MSDRERAGLRGAVKSCADETTYPRPTEALNNGAAEVRFVQTTQYDPDGRSLLKRNANSDGSQWVLKYEYDTAGRLVSISSGTEGQAATRTNYSYDQQGRMQSIQDEHRPGRPVTFQYDEHGRKTKVAVSSASDYRPNVAIAGSPFAAADRAPNLPGGGSATTIYDDSDRAIEVQIRDSTGEMMSRATRAYDSDGRIVEEKQILDNPETMIPAEFRAQMLQQTGLSEDELRQELRTKLTGLMAGRSGPYSVSYTYDKQGRISHTSRRIFNGQDEIDSAYNERGDVASEITRSTPPGGDSDTHGPRPGLPSYSETRYTYQYDEHRNWIEKTTSYRSSADGTFESSGVIKRTLTYY